MAVALVARERPESLRESDVRLALRKALGFIMLELFGRESWENADRLSGRLVIAHPTGPGPELGLCWPHLCRQQRAVSSDQTVR